VGLCGGNFVVRAVSEGVSGGEERPTADSLQLRAQEVGVGGGHSGLGLARSCHDPSTAHSAQNAECSGPFEAQDKRDDRFWVVVALVPRRGDRKWLPQGLKPVHALRLRRD